MRLVLASGILGPIGGAGGGIDAHDAVFADLEIAQFAADAAGLFHLGEEAAALGVVAHGGAAAGGRPDGRDQRSGAQSFGGELLGEAGEIVVGGIDIGVRQGEEEIDAIEAHAIDFGRRR